MIGEETFKSQLSSYSVELQSRYARKSVAFQAELSAKWKNANRRQVPLRIQLRELCDQMRPVPAVVLLLLLQGTLTIFTC